MKQKNDMVGLIIKGVYYTAAFVTSSLAFGFISKVGDDLAEVHMRNKAARENAKH